MPKPLTDSLISYSELDAVATLANALCAGDTGRHPGVQLSLTHGQRRWTLVTPDTVVTYVGEDGGHGLERPVWIPCSALFWAAEAAQPGDACSFRIDHGESGSVLSVAGVTASGAFELPTAEPVEPVTTRSLLPHSVVDVCVSAQGLRGFLRAATRAPRQVRPDERPPVALHVDGPDVLTVGVNWEACGGLKATYRLAVEADGNLERLRPLQLEPWALSTVAGLLGEDEITVSFLSDSTIAIVHGNLRAVFLPVGGQVVLPPTLSDVVEHYYSEPCGTHTAVWVGEAKVRLIPFPEDGIVRASIELARSVEPSPELFEVLNSLNTRLGRGRLVQVRDRIYATVEVPDDDLARLPEVMGRLADEVAPLGLSLAPFGRRVVGGKVVSDDPLTSEDLPVLDEPPVLGPVDQDVDTDGDGEDA